MMQGVNIEMSDQHSVTDTYNSDLSEVPMDSVEAGASLPTPEAIRLAVSPRRKSGLKAYTYIIVGTVLLLGVVIGLGVGFSKRDAWSRTAAEPVPRMATSEELIEYFSSQQVSDQFRMLNPSLPQGKAIEWLAERDGRNLAVPNASVSTDEGYALLERFVLAVIYYSTGGDAWRSQLGFLTGSDICSWGGLRFGGSTFYNVGVVCTGGGPSRHMDTLYLDQNALTGTVPTEVGALTKLDIFDLNSNGNLTGTIPTELCMLPKLRVIGFLYDDLTGAIPDCFGDLEFLRLLLLSNNRLEGAVPPSLASLSNLEGLYLDDNFLTGDITTMFNNMPNLTRVYAEDNQLSGTLDENFLAGNENIVYIDLSTNEISGLISPHVFALPELVVLDLHQNQLSGPLPDNLANNTKLELLALHENNITGPIPAALASLEGLTHLDLSSNLFDGEMPTDIGSMDSLEYLFLADNPGLTAGPVPPEYANLVQLEELNLKSTNRNGQLPEFIADFSSLILLDLDDNDFSGGLPANYSKLNQLEFLLLNRNEALSGEVPPEYSDLVSLRVVFLDQTGLTGTMDPLCSIPSLTEVDGDVDGNETVTANCGGSSPPITQCTCCDICCESGVECHDNDLVASLTPIWERRFNRVFVTLGNDTRYVDRDYLPGGG